MGAKDTIVQGFQHVKHWLQSLSFRTGVIVLLCCIPFYILSFAQMLLPISVAAKGVLWTILFGMAKTCQYGGLTILGVEGYKRLKSMFKKENRTMKKPMTWTVLTDNRSSDPRLVTEHGLSILLQTGNRQILLDTGASDVLVRNAALLGIDLSTVDMVFLSHGHSDHAGGLRYFMAKNQRAKVVVSPHAMSGQFYSKRGNLHSITTEWPEMAEDRLLLVDETCGIADGRIMAVEATCGIADGHMQAVEATSGIADGHMQAVEATSGIADGIKVIAHIQQQHAVPKGNRNLFIKDAEGQYVPDDFRHEIAFYTDGFLFTGCAHSGLENILSACPWPVKTVVGGFHLLDGQETDAELTALAHRLQRDYPDTRFFTSHCTGDAVFDVMKAVMGEQLQHFTCGMKGFVVSG